MVVLKKHSWILSILGDENRTNPKRFQNHMPLVNPAARQGRLGVGGNAIPIKDPWDHQKTGQI